MIWYLMAALLVTMVSTVIGIYLINKKGNYETWYGAMAYLSLFASILLFLAILFCVHWVLPIIVVGGVALLLQIRYNKLVRNND